MCFKAFAARVMDDGITWLIRGIVLVVEQAMGVDSTPGGAMACAGWRMSISRVTCDVRRYSTPCNHVAAPRRVRCL